MSKEHFVRTIAVCVAFLGVGGVYLYLLVSGNQLPGVAARLEGMLAVLTPAVLDTVRHGKVEQRRASLRPPAPDPDVNGEHE